MALGTAIGMSVEDADRWSARPVAGFEAALSAWLTAAPAPAILHAWTEPCPVAAGADVPPGLFLTAAALAATRPDCPIAAVPGLRAELYRPVLAAIDARIPAEPVADPPPVSGARVAYDLSEPLVTHLMRLVGLLAPREAQALAAWLLAEGAAPGYAAAGARLGISPQRTHRLVESALARIDGRSGFAAILGARLAQARQAAPVDLAELLSEPWAAGLPANLFGVMLQRYGDLHVHRDPRIGDKVLPFPSDKARKILDGLRWAVARVDSEGAIDPAIEAYLRKAVPERAYRGPARRLIDALLGTRRHVAACLALGLNPRAVDHLLAPFGDEPARLADIHATWTAADPAAGPGAELRVLLDGHALPLGDDLFVRRAAPAADPAARRAARQAVAIVRAEAEGRPWPVALLMGRLPADADGIAELTPLRLERALLADGRLTRYGPWTWGHGKPASKPAQERLPAAPEAPTRPIPATPRYDLSMPLAAHLRTYLDRLPDRQARILAARFPAEGEALTFEEIARDIGVTHQRTRQLAEAGLRRIDALTGFEAVLRERLRAAHAALPLALDTLLAEPWAHGLAPNAVTSLLIQYGDLHVHRRGRPTPLLLPFVRAEWDTVLQALREVVGRMEPFHAVLPNLEPELDRLFPDPTCRSAAGRLVAEHLAGLSTLAACRRLGLDARLVELLLPEGDEAVSLEAAHAAWRAADPEAGSVQTLRLLLGEHGLHLGNEHFVRRDPPERDSLARRAATLCVRLVREGPRGRRWRTEELRAGLAPSHPDLAALVPLRLERALARDGRLDRPRPWVWATRSGRAGEIVTPEMHAERILRRQGQPMSIVELTRQAFAAFGPRKTAQLRPTGDLAILAHGTWGLASRDLPLARAGEAATLARALMAQGPLTADALHAALAGTGLEGIFDTPHALASVLRTGAGFTTGIGGMLRLPEAAPVPREGSWTERILALLAAHPSGIAFADLTRILSEGTDRSPSRSILGAVLRERAVKVALRPDVWVLREIAEAAGLTTADQAPKPSRRLRQGPPTPVPVMDTGRRGTPYPMRQTYPKDRKPAPTRAATFDWTEERVALLTELWKREVRMSEIQRQLGGGITKNAIAGKLHRLKLFGDSRGATA